ncbi:MAG: serpin family protein [Ilumatobacteraceae bacterium]
MNSSLDRRRFLTLLSAPVVLGVLHSCGSDTSTTASTTSSTTDESEFPVTSDADTGANGVARSSKPRETVCTCDASVASDAINAFGTDLYGLLARSTDPATNLVFSPASIAIALAMTRAGAAGATATEMDAVLHVGDPALFPSSMNALQLGFDERNQSIDMPGSDEPAEIVLSVTNSLWGQQGFGFENTFLDLLAVNYGAGVQLVDYRNDADGARKAINRWVADETEDRIPALLAPGTITPDARLTLVNAILMKAPWQKPFDEYFTTDGPFTTAAGSVVQTAMMRQTERFDYADGVTWRALELPYAGELLSMIIVLPNEGAPLSDAVAAVSTLANPAHSSKVAVKLPTFDIDTQVGFGDTLAALGMPTAFDPDQADFSAMAVLDPTDPEPLFIGAVVHQANIMVDEDGTEAAAATAIVMVAGAAPGPSDEPIEFTVDRPFVFAIRDNPTGTILFLGHIADPTQRRS